VVDIAKLYAQSGMFTYDPGFTSTASCQSKITYIDGDAGVLEYRGYPIEQPMCPERTRGKWRATADEDGHYCFAVAL
jgi:citrate synthase